MAVLFVGKVFAGIGKGGATAVQAVGVMYVLTAGLIGGKRQYTNIECKWARFEGWGVIPFRYPS